MFKFFKRFLTRKRRQPAETEVRSPDERLNEVLLRARERLDRFLVTRSRESGLIKKTDSWSLVKTSPGLFRLEAQGLSVLISTEPFLALKDGKLNGLLRMSEMELCRALKENGKPAGFFNRGDELPAASRAVLDGFLGSDQDERDPESLPELGDLLDWSLFDLDRMISLNSANTLALVLIRSEPDVENLLRGRLSSGMKRMLVQETEILLGAGSRPELNPHTRLRVLLDYEDALLEFRRTMLSYLTRERLRRERERTVSTVKA